MSKRIKVSSLQPDRNEVEKIAKTIVIHVKKDPEADPYEMIRSTGLSNNLMEAILNKFNIHSFLHDFNEATEDPHNRDVGAPPLSLDKLFEGCGCDEGSGDPNTQVTKIEGPGMEGVSVRKKVVLPMNVDSQARDLNDVSKVDLGKEEPTPANDPPPAKTEEGATDRSEAKVASFHAWDDGFTDVSSEKLASAIEALDDELYEKAHAYYGTVQKLAGEVIADPSLEKELLRCHRDSLVTHHIFKAAELDMPEVETPKWTLIQNEKLAAILSELSAKFDEIGEHQKTQDVLRGILESRQGA